jgi:hypothetical protein
VSTLWRVFSQTVALNFANRSINSEKVIGVDILTLKWLLDRLPDRSNQEEERKFHHSQLSVTLAQDAEWRVGRTLSMHLFDAITGTFSESIFRHHFLTASMKLLFVRDITFIFVQTE